MEVTEADRELLARLFDLNEQQAMQIRIGAMDGKAYIWDKLELIAAHRAKGE